MENRQSPIASNALRLAGVALAIHATWIAAAPADAGNYITGDRQETADVDAAAGSNPFVIGLRAATVLAAKDDDDLPLGRDALFGDEPDVAGKAETKPAQAKAAGGGLRGFVQVEMARAIDSPVHWSKMLTRAELGSQGSLASGIKWKVGARLDFDAVYSLDDYYPPEVARDQRFNVSLRENYLDISAGDWDLRLGRQHVIWGEMIGLFFADVVSAREQREFILPEFDIQRIPQWAARAEYFKDDFHAELLWIPVASYDEIGKPYAEFFPWQPAVTPNSVYRQEVRPDRNLSNSNYGARLTTLTNGWDLSAFVYRSMDVAPTFYRQITGPAGNETSVFEARHDRIDQVGGTVTKDFGSVVLKGEGVYTHGRQFTVLRQSDPDGVVPENTLDWALGLDFALPAETRLNFQVFQRVSFQHDDDTVFDKVENGYSIYLFGKPTSKLEAQVTWIASLNRTDWLLRPRLAWNFERNWRLALGADIFNGPPLGFFGQYDSRDRVYSELRYSF